MPHSPLKKAIGALILAAYLAAAVVQVPMASASSFFSVEEKTSETGLLGKNVKDSRDLVAIIADEDTWDEFDSEIKQYAEDVQRSLPKTNTLIIPVPDRSETVLKLQQVLQKLYLEGEGNTSLRGIVIIGDVPLPVLAKNDQSFISLLPYTDFIDPTYVFDEERQQFVRSRAAPAELKPEVWHGVIRPSKKGEDAKKQLKEFFEKNHRFHSGEPEFSQFQKKIFMNDLVREEEDMNIESFPRYQNFLKNMEDIAYSRYSAKWLAELEGSDIKNFKGMPDIQSKEPIMKHHLQYPELFGTLFSVYANFVSGSGRWSEDDIESMPSLIAKQDLAMMQTLRSANDAMEVKIDEQLEKIAKKLPLYLDVQLETTVLKGNLGLPQTYITRFVNNSIIGGKQYVNGVAFEDITSAQQCSLYGGSTQMVKFLRALNPFTVRVKPNSKTDPRLMPSVGALSKLVSADRAKEISGGKENHGALIDTVFADVPLAKNDLLLDIDRRTIDGAQSLEVILGDYQVGQAVSAHVYRPSISKDLALNFSLVDANAMKYVAGCHGGNYGTPSKCYPKAATLPVGDRAGTMRVNDASSFSEMDLGKSCTLLTPLKTFADFLEEVQENENPPLPSRDPSKILLADTLTRKFTLQQFLDFVGYKPPPSANEQQKWEDIQKRFLTPESEQTYTFGDVIVKISPPSKYKDISSVAYHKEPTNETLGAQYQAVVSSALPIDKPRYAEFTDSAGERRKVIYPNAFGVSTFEDFSLKLQDTEKLLAIFGAKGVSEILREGLDEKKLRDALEWKSLSLEAKHRRIYDSSSDSFEAMRFVANGSPTSYTSNFSGEGLIGEDDPEYLGITDDEDVRGKGEILVKPGEVTIGAEEGATLSTAKPQDQQDDQDVVDIFAWHTAIQKWLSDLKNSFRPMSLSVSDEDENSENVESEGKGNGGVENGKNAQKYSKNQLSLRATSDKKSLGPSSSTTLVFSLVDESGRVADDVSVPVNVRITPKTQTYGNISLSNGKTAKEAIVYAQHGVGAVSVSSSMVAGPIHLVLCSPGIRCGSFDIASFGVGSSINSRSLYVSMHGGPFGKVSEPQYLAGTTLFSGKTQAVSSVTTEPKAKRRLLSLDAYGRVRLLDAASLVSIYPSGPGEPLQVSLSHDLGKTTDGELFIRQQGVSIVTDFTSVAQKAGTFVQLSASDSPYSLEQNSSGVLLKEGSRILARVNSSGGIERLDSRVRLQMGESGKYFSVDIFVGEVLAATSQIQFDAVNSVAMLAVLKDFGIGVWLVNSVRGNDVAFEPAFSGFSSNEPMGYTLVSNVDGAKTLQAGDDKHILLLAAGATVGEANLPHASEIGIVLGDPTVRFGSPNDVSSSGFTRDIGISVGSVATGSDILLPIDVNTDTKRDLLVASRSGEMTYFQYVGGSQKFIDRGVVIHAKHGILDAAVADVDGDSDEDVIVAVKEPCTKNESCVDVYLNQRGLFVRQNMGLKIAEGVRVAVLRANDLNVDGQADLLVSLTDGSVYVFYREKDVFQSYGQLIGNFEVSGSKKVMLTAGVDVTRGAGIEIGSGGSDDFPDILAQVEGSSRPVYFVSDPSRSTKGGNVTYVRREVTTSEISQTDAAKKLKDDLASAFLPEKIDGSQTKALGVSNSSAASASAAMDLLVKENGKDMNADGTPDYLDTLPKTFDGIANSVSKTIEKLRCAPGCFPMPLNFAFLAPGDININGKPVGYDPGLPVFGAVGSCANWPIWPVCPYTDKAMNFRLYVSPTTTGQVGFGICVGSPYPQNGAQGEPGARCYAFAPNISLIPKGICKAITSQMNVLLKRAKGFGTGSGFTSFIAGGGDNFTSTDTKNTRTIAGNSASDLLAPYQSEINVATNIRVPGFPKSFTNWLDRQIEEVTDKLADLPDIIVKYPQLSSFGRAFVPKMDSGKIKSYSTFLAFLNSIPLVTIDPKPVSIVVPTLTKNQIEKFSKNLDRFWEDLNMEALRVKEIFGCSKAKKGDRYIDLCTLIDVRANKILDRINQNYRTLETYKNLPIKLVEYRNIETKYVGQIINYMDKVTNFIGGYVKKQQKRLSTWIELTKSIQKALKSWQAVVDVTQKYAQNCDGCKTDRNSLFPMLLSTFVKISEPPVIEFPKWPDIVLDFSRVELGTRITWPDVTFTPKQILLPVLPSVKLPVPPSGDFDAMKVKLDLNKAFDSMIPQLPELPELPVLPTLPDLPPLPVFKLPDLPPAPKIPSLKMIKSVNLSKSLGTIKELLKIVCMIKKGYVVVNENSLKTEIEALTQRSVTPPLALDLADTLESPSIKYNAVDQILIQGAMKFELETDAVYKLFKEFADSINSINADLVQGLNEEGKSVEKSLKKLSSWNGEMRYVAQAGQKDSGVGGISTAKFGDDDRDADFNKAVSDAYSDYAESQAEPTGLYIQNPKTGLPEKLIDYTPPISSDVHIADSDIDADKDSDIFYTQGRDIFFKENYTTTVGDEFTKFDTSGSTVKKLDALLPLAPAVYGISIDDSQASLTTVSWHSAGSDIVGYELALWNERGASRRRYLSDSAGGKIPFDESVPVEKISLEKISLEKVQTITLDLTHGNTYFQIIPLTSHGKRGTRSEVRLLAPQVCGNANPLMDDLTTPDIILRDVSMKDGRASGFVQPAKPSQPFSLVRERNGSSSVIGDYQTDENGNFSVTGLSLDGTTVIKNASGDIVAEYDPDTGGLRSVRDGYLLRSTQKDTQELVDQNGQVLLRVVRVPDKNGKYIYTKSPTILDSKEFAATEVLQITPVTVSPFADVPVNSPLYDAVSTLEEVDIVEGYRENGQSLFKPDQTITRAEYTKIVLKSLCIEPRAEAYDLPSPFYDITYNKPLDWFYAFVKESYLRSLITGYLGEKDASGRAPFRPLANISRAEGTKILIEALRMLRIVAFPQGALVADKKEPWYVRYMEVAQNLSPYILTSDDPNLREKFVITSSEARLADNALTRGDFALMASRVLKINDCYRDEREELKKKKAQDEANKKKLEQKKLDADSKRKGGDGKDGKSLSEKISKLPPGVYFIPAPCNACPCSVTIDSTSDLALGDSIFAIIYSLDRAHILRKSNVIVISKP